MSGKFSRDKGAREELGLVQQLKDLGYDDVKRVPLSGAAKGFKFDVLASQKGTQYSFELKTRSETFLWLYKFLATEGIPRFVYRGKMVSIGKTPIEASSLGFDNPFTRIPEDHAQVKLFSRIVKLADLKKDADFLVLKSNRKHRIFIKYWDDQKSVRE